MIQACQGVHARHMNKWDTQGNHEIKMEVFGYLPCVKGNVITLITFDIGLIPYLWLILCLISSPLNLQLFIFIFGKLTLL